MTLDKRLIGKKAVIYYDRHIISCIDSSSSDLNTVEGVVEDLCEDMVVISYTTKQQVRSVQKGIFSDKVSYVEKNAKKTSFINLRYIVKIDLIDVVN